MIYKHHTYNPLLIKWLYKLFNYCLYKYDIKQHAKTNNQNINSPNRFPTFAINIIKLVSMGLSKQPHLLISYFIKT